MIDTYTPEMPAEHWAVIGDFVREAVRESEPNTPYNARTLIGVTTQLVWWAWKTAGLELDRAVVFDRHTIEEYIGTGCGHLTPASRGNRRSQLFRVAEVLLGDIARTQRLAVLPSADPVRPYSEAELNALVGWSNGRSTEVMRRNSSLLIALGAGAGIATEDIGWLMPADVTVDDEGVLVEVKVGRRPRIIPVLRSWEQPIVDALEGTTPDEFLFRPGRTTTTKHTVGQFLTMCGGDLRPSLQRLRATWIVHHLAACTPIVPFIAAAGVQSLEAINRYVRYVPGIDPKAARRALRQELRQI